MFHVLGEVEKLENATIEDPSTLRYCKSHVKVLIHTTQEFCEGQTEAS